MHINKGKTIAQCLKARVDYIENPEKTNGGELISSYACSPETADQEFLLARNEYMAITGRRIHNEVIAYQLRQSFKPGEVTPEEANRIGYELASRFLKSEHAFLVATHNDRRHVHNHIVFCATALDCTRKFRDILRSGKVLAELSDQICEEHQLSVIREPENETVAYGKWLGEIIVCTGIKTRYLVHDRISRGQHDDRHITLLADSSKHLQTVESRKHHIQHHEVEATGQSFVQPCSSIKYLLRLVSLVQQLQLHKSCNFLFILHNENLLCHIFFLSFMTDADIVWF